MAQWAVVGIGAGTTFLAVLLAGGISVWLAQRERKAADRVRREERLHHSLRGVQTQLYETGVAGERRSMAETLKLSNELEILSELLTTEHPEVSKYFKDLSLWYYKNRLRRDQLRREFAARIRPVTEKERAQLSKLVRDHGSAYGWVRSLLVELYVGKVNLRAVESHQKFVTEELARLANQPVLVTKVDKDARVGESAEALASSRARELWISSKGVWPTAGRALLIVVPTLIVGFMGGRGRR